jgi:hypothetical protein
MSKLCVSCGEEGEFRKSRRKCKRCEKALQPPWQGQTAYAKEWMRRKRADDPRYGRNPVKALRGAFKSLARHPEYLLSRHPLASHSDFREMIDQSPNPCEAMMLREDAA